MKVYTKTGDKGTTGLLGGTRVSKSALRIESYGTVDELNSHMGMVRDQPVNASLVDELINIQNTLFVIGSHLASDPEKSKVVIPDIENSQIEKLEKAIDRMDAELPEMRNFVLPGGHISVSTGHIARCVCRRAERIVTGLAAQEPVEDGVTIYLNRLSDYLFVLCRWMTHRLNAPEVPWKP
ncbi:cob(I)yrinic acid a,c-diamide adenosyltransferase [Reichenbachiella carrageenanivorans]|uniref:Corrinoid adenosyltransferase n=1 Tax=Reichenbachiella carrageenanivorans TaxID=2979869 RepID=A0ABY6CVR1_9BACT|nr:cob(I)yrinic acid a,c-diamide adenosyltransferase [Reichenbachiella carrageenanivorans]UXX77996.1 cob(I)yrinic acid a,c-diamide adenosyltransferase [Reichenbachiella carrageenanivorans]